MGGLFSTSYDVQKVGQNVKGASKKRTSSSVSYEIKTTESGNNVFAKSDLEIIGPVEEFDAAGRKEEAKTVRIDETKTEVFEHVEAREDPPPPQISPEERKKQEDLIMAMVRGEIHPRDSVSEDPTVIVKTIGSITALEAQGQLENCSASIDEENLSTPEELVEKSSVTEDSDALREVVQAQVNNNVGDGTTSASSVQDINAVEGPTVAEADLQLNLEVVPLADTTAEDLKCAKGEVVTENNVDSDLKKLEDDHPEHFDISTECKLNVTADINLNVREGVDPNTEPSNAPPKSTEIIVASESKPEVGKDVGAENKIDEILVSGPSETKDESVAAQIQNVEEKARKLKEKIINFSGTSKNKEYDELYQTLAGNILKLDDLSCSSTDLDNERRRVIKILQQCMENLERKIETVQNVAESDSE